MTNRSVRPGISFGQWLAIGAIFIGPASVALELGMPSGFDAGPLAPGLLATLPVLALIAFGVARGSRLAFILLAGIAVMQLIVWVVWSVSSPELAAPFALPMYGLVLLGLWLARDRFWRRAG